jgi:hypothetical protein
MSKYLLPIPIFFAAAITYFVFDTAIPEYIIAKAEKQSNTSVVQAGKGFASILENIAPIMGGVIALQGMVAFVQIFLKSKNGRV